MTPCEEKGYKVGDKFEVLDDIDGFKKGQTLTLHRDDGTDIPLFKGENDRFKHADGELGAYVHIDNVRPVESKPLTEQLRSAIAKRDKQKAKAKRHAQKFEQREADVQRLIGELEREIEEATGLVCNIKEPLRGSIPDCVDVDDPGTWEKGDVIKCTRSSSDCFTEGVEYVFNRIDPSDDSVEVQRDDEGDKFGSRYATFRFVRRPS